jgi:hypothetical protein
MQLPQMLARSAVPLALLPNTRVKLSAPSFYGGHPFMNIRASRRSLRAIR